MLGAPLILQLAFDLTPPVPSDPRALYDALDPLRDHGRPPPTAHPWDKGTPDSRGIGRSRPGEAHHRRRPGYARWWREWNSVRIVRGLVGTVLWILAAVLGLLAVIMCVTIILLPVGIALLWLSRRLFGASARQFVPRGMRHPLREADKSARKRGREARQRAKQLNKSLPDLDLGGASRKSPRFLKRRRKRLPVFG
jgi:hypothetical protein